MTTAPESSSLHVLRRRWRVPVFVLAAALASAAGGFIAAGELQPRIVDPASLEQRPVTAEVQRRVLEATIVTRGDLGYGDSIPVRLAGTVYTDNTRSSLVVTRPPKSEARLTAGVPLAEISGRPVFVLQGSLPMYRPLGEGAEGPDVRQLEGALAAIGLDPGRLDAVYDAALQRAVERLYSAKGYVAPRPTDEATDMIRARRAAADQAEDAVADAQAAYNAALHTADGSGRLELEEAVAAAQAALTEVQAEVSRANAEMQLALLAAQGAAGVAESTLHEARATGRDPRDPQRPCTQPCLQELQQEAVLAEVRVQAADADRARVEAAGMARLDQARLSVDLAQARLAEAAGGETISSTTRRLNRAREALAQALAELNAAVVRGRAVIPQGELVFMPTLPMVVREVKVRIGDAATNDLAVVASEHRVVRATVPLSDLSQIRVGMTARLDSGTGTRTFDGRVISATQAAEAGVDAGAEPVGQLLVDGSAISADVTSGQTLRVVLIIRTTSGQAVVVPMIAVTTTATGDAKVTVIEGDGASTRVALVRVGLIADGMAEVAAIDGELEPGDRVEVG